jgi:nicotinate dehydrogenase subunit B
MIARDRSEGASRREFLKMLGGGLLVVLVTRDLPAEPALGARLTGAAPGAPQIPEDVGAWLHIDANGDVTVFTGKVEFGQGIRTSLAQEVAEELRVPLSAVRLVMGDTMLTPFDMGTFGSRSTPQMGTQLRKVGATARERLVALAAEHWHVDPGGLTAAGGRVTDPRTRRSLRYGELTAGQTITATVNDGVALTPKARWTVAGTSAPHVGGRDLVTGRHQYTSDMRVPDMRYAKILRAPSIGATLASLDASAAQAIPGVVVTRDGDFVGVTAPSAPAAAKALGALRATWTPASGPEPSSRDISDYLRHTPAPEAGPGHEGGSAEPFERGDVTAALAAAPHRLTQSYTVAYIAHVPLEPRAALAQITHEAGGDRLTVWTGTQRPFAVRDQVAQAVGMPNDRVRVIVPDTGSGYGGKHTGEAAVEAARLAQKVGRPVKLVWTREEEFRWAYFRPAGVIDVDAAVDANGIITAWTFDNYNSGPAAIRPPYPIANQRVVFHPSVSPLRQGSYRALAATANHFARESHVSELAHIVQMDPVAFRLKNIDDPRLHDVVQKAADTFGWPGPNRQAGHGVGVACGFEKGGYVATCAEVSVDHGSGDVHIVRAVTAFDCGAIVNPDGLRNQISGALVQGIGGALFEAIEFDHGVIRNPHLADYRVPRFSDVPAIEVVLVDRPDEPSMGAGEAPIMALAPAAAAALFEATGVRLRALPMAPSGIKLAAASGSGGR